VAKLRADELPRAADVLARAYQDNPLMYYFFGDNPDARLHTNRAVLHRRLASMRPPPLVIRDGSALIGICGFDPPGGSKMSPEDMQVIMESLAAIDADAPARAMQMLADWSTRAPSEPHWHLGPVGVDPARQGSGIGTTLVRAFCEMMDREGTLAFLETDIEKNADLYARFDFETTHHVTVYGVPLWFMTRRPQS
jgi:ribosomal protein S18 acetylase RimI-like enzyme